MKERTDKRGVRARRQAVGAAFAVSLHVAFYVIFFLPLDRIPYRVTTEDDSGAVTVSLMRGTSAQAAQASHVAELDQLAHRLEAEFPSSIPAGNKQSVQSTAALLKLFDAPETVVSAVPPVAANQAKPGHSGDHGHGARIVDPSALASAFTEESADRAVIWPQVRRCWRPHGDTASVSMVVRLDASGGLDGQPLVFRASAPVDRNLLQAEQDATAAVWACAPYHVGGGGRSAFQLLFKAGS